MSLLLCYLFLFILCDSCVALKNVLFIIAEDFRVDLSFYDRHHVIAPNIERLAARGVVFDHAICQVSICAPSRASMLTGLRPETLGIYDFNHFGFARYFRTIPSHFHRLGYESSMSGKVYHWESPRHWSSGYWGAPLWENKHLEEEEGIEMLASVNPDSKHTETFFRDYIIATTGIEFMRSMVANSRSSSLPSSPATPWFLAIGFKGTHMPYHMPKKYWNLYENTTFHIDESMLRFPLSAPLLHHVKKTESVAIEYMDVGTRKEMYQRNGHGRTISLRGWQELYRGYLACLTFMDAQLGKVLDALDELRLWEDTVVVFTSDHGMHVGEKGIWGKWTLFDETTRVPLVIHDPANPTSFGQHYLQPVELIDLFPTLVDLSGAALEVVCPAIPAASSERVSGEGRSNKSLNFGYNASFILRHAFCDPLDGVSLAPIFSSFVKPANSPPLVPLISSFQKPFPFALTQRMTCKMPGFADNDPLTPSWIDFCPYKKIPRNPPFGSMGYSLRSLNWRYTAWLELDTNSMLPSLHLPPMAEELYDHRPGPLSRTPRTATNMNGAGGLGEKETVNLVHNNEFASILQEMRVTLYDFLWFNSSFQHIYFQRLDSPKLKTITHGRFFKSKHPHREQFGFPHHFYFYISMYAKANAFTPKMGLTADEFVSISGIRNQSAIFSNYFPTSSSSFLESSSSKAKAVSRKKVASKETVAAAKSQAQLATNKVFSFSSPTDLGSVENKLKAEGRSKNLRSMDT